MMLQMLGHDVRTVHDGPSAIAAVPEFGPDLIFLDIGMPRMNGYETCRQIRGQPNGQDAVIVALSGWGQDHDKQRSRDAGMDLHLVKPFDPALLESMLAKLGGRDSASGRPREMPPAPDPAPQAQLDAANAAPAIEATSAAVDSGPIDPEAAVEAARYALYRRILPVLRHGLVGELQSVQFAVNLAKHACVRANGTNETQDAIGRIAEQAHAAVGRGQAITDWLRPDPAATMTVGEAVHACLDLVGTEWSLRGIEVNASVPAANEVVRGGVVPGGPGRDAGGDRRRCRREQPMCRSPCASAVGASWCRCVPARRLAMATAPASRSIATCAGPTSARSRVRTASRGRGVATTRWRASRSPPTIDCRPGALIACRPPAR